MKTLITLFIVTVCLTSFAGNENRKEVKEANAINKTATYSIKGKVVDKISGEALAGVKVVLTEGEEACYTDFDGNFVIENVYSGSYTIATNYISYQNNVIKNVKSEFQNDVVVELLPIETE